MEFRYRYRTGHYDEILPTLYRAIEQYRSEGQRVSVGVAVDPEQRAQEYDAGDWQEMVVIYRTTSVPYAAAVMGDLVAQGWERDGLSMDTNPEGGEAAPTAKYYYIYMLLG